MGQGITVECKSCDYQKSFTLGVGMMYSSLENVIGQVNPRQREMVLHILHNEEIHEIDYQHKLFACPNCHTLVERFNYYILFNDNKKCESEFHCPKCRTKLSPLGKPIENVPCPKCGRKTLSKFMSMLWD